MHNKQIAVLTKLQFRQYCKSAHQTMCFPSRSSFPLLSHVRGVLNLIIQIIARIDCFEAWLGAIMQSSSNEARIWSKTIIKKRHCSGAVAITVL